MKTLLSLCLIAVSTAVVVPQAVAAEKASPAEKGEKTGGKESKSVPFHGKISAVDVATKVITVGERKFQVTSDTRLMKAGKPATFGDATVGEDVGGAYREVGGTMTLTSLRIGPKPEGKKEK